jgi:DNA-binding transcriptional MerR regulator
MKIGELAQRTGLAASKIRFYEAQGLLAPVQRHANGYREYPPRSARLLAIIAAAQAGGFSLDEIRHLLPVAGMEKWNKQNLLVTLRRKVSEIEQLQRKLRENKARLLEVIARTEKPPLPCSENAEQVMKKLTRVVRQRAIARS